MRALLITLTVLEIIVVLVALIYYLRRISGSLQRTSVLLGKVAFGVRAIETQCSSIGPTTLTINEQLRGVRDGLATLAGLADEAASVAASSPGGR